MKGWRWSLKYDPGQPRVPAGDPQGGQWTSGGAGQNVPKVLERGNRPEDVQPGAFGPREYSELAKNMNISDPKVIEAISDYKRDSSNSLNAWLRSDGKEGAEYGEQIREWTSRLDEAMTLELPESIMVYRFTTKTNPSYTDKGFVSTTHSPMYAEYFQQRFGEGRGKIVQVIVPKGTRVALIGEIGHRLFEDEGELLLPRGGKFKKIEALDGTDAWVFWAPGSPQNP